MKPSSFCYVSTNPCKEELFGSLLSLSLYHRDAPVFVICDDDTARYIDESTPNIKLDITFIPLLNTYTNETRTTMEEKGIFGKFLEFKMNVMSVALDQYEDTLFVDCDIIFTNVVDICEGYEVGLSPQFISKEHRIKTGEYNAGFVWTNNKQMPKVWKSLINHTNHCPEQINMHQLKEHFNSFDFGCEYNIQAWRHYLGDKVEFETKNKKIYHNGKQVVCIHTHFNDQRFQEFNGLFIGSVVSCDDARLLSIIGRVLFKKWIISIPQQPQSGIHYHKNDTFRELCLLFKTKHKDVELAITPRKHVTLNGAVLFYDRPTDEWFDDEVYDSSLVYVGNMKKQDYQHIKQARPFIFWGRRPNLLENQELSQERKHTIIYIGNIENSVQEEYRKGDWEPYIDKYIQTKGMKHALSQSEYLQEMSQAKFGYCPRGYGAKTNREIECLALGVVPIFTDDTSIDYINPLIEGVHYIKCNDPKDIHSIIDKVDWEQMSKNCREWYMKNAHSQNAWFVILDDLFYQEQI